MALRHNPEDLERLAKLVRYYILVSTTKAGSGHPTSAMSATELMVALMFGGRFRYDPDRPSYPNNDRLIFSKGHASPLVYSLWAAAGRLTEKEMLTYRQFGSPLEGHPTVAFPYVDAATGSLGQGLSIGVGMALNGRYLDKLPYRTYVLLGDSEMAEGSQWEAIQLSAHYHLDNLVGVLDVNRLGQRGQTMYGHVLEAYDRRIAAFGWHTIVIDGHSFPQILDAYEEAASVSGRPTMIIARTIKGKGLPEMEDKNGWHGKALSQEQMERALKSWEPIDKSVRGKIAAPEAVDLPGRKAGAAGSVDYPAGKPVATRTAYGNALCRVYPACPEIVALDGEVSNSTRSDLFKEEFPERFFEMYIAEQNLAGAALGLSVLGKIPFASTFAAFWSRAFDQVRMSQYSDANIKFVGSHAGVSIGEDGPSQMALEDLAMFRSVGGGVVLHPCDAVSTEKLVEAAARHRGIVYLRTMRQETPILYSPGEEFHIGGCKTLRRSDRDAVTIVGAGATVHEALAAWEVLKKEGILCRVIDLYSIKPLDQAALADAARTTRAIVTVEDHYPEGGLGEAVMSAVAEQGVPLHSLAVRKKPKSGTPGQLREFEEISSDAIVRKVRAIVGVETASLSAASTSSERRPRKRGVPGE